MRIPGFEPIMDIRDNLTPRVISGKLLACSLDFRPGTRSLWCSVSTHRLRRGNLQNEHGQHPFPMVAPTNKHFSSSFFLCSDLQPVLANKPCTCEAAAPSSLQPVLLGEQQTARVNGNPQLLPTFPASKYQSMC